MVNIKDVALHANVSVATVSRFLNEKGYVSEQTKKKIEATIETLQYKPNQIARSLSTKQSNILGLIVPDIQNPYFPELARAIEDTALMYNYTVVLCNSDHQIEKEQMYLQRLASKYVAGILVTSNHPNSAFFKNSDIPIVALDRTIQSNIPSVSTDNIKGAYEGTKYLIQQGATEILFLRGPVGIPTADERYQGFLQAAKAYNVAIHVIEVGFEFREAEKQLHAFMETHPFVNAIFASNDASAIAAMKVMHSSNKRIPEDIQIMGFDGIELGVMVYPELTTVSQDIYAIGKHATEMLIAQIEGHELIEKTIKVPTTLLIRGTTKEGITI